MEQKFLSLNEASKWATDYLKREVTPCNISYLIQYAKIMRHSNGSGEVVIDLDELKDYYNKNIISKRYLWKKKLGGDLNWTLSFDNLREADTTKHVHRLHPYKGKFIPQLVEYFLNDKTNGFKKQIFFKEGDIVLDPFVGSGTTLVQASELGLHSIGIDVSEFNCLISKVKTDDYDFKKLEDELKKALKETLDFSEKSFKDAFDIELKNKISEFNKEYFPEFEFKRKVMSGQINEEEYGKEKLKQFLYENRKFFEENGTKDNSLLRDEKEMNTFLSKWFSKRIKQELFYYLNLINRIQDEKIKNIMRVVLTRTARSCRATTHSDLATLKDPQLGPYYCHKHKKICTPVNSMLKHLQKNTFDTIQRLKEFSNLKKEVFTEIIRADSRVADINEEIKKKNQEFYNLLKERKIDGVFTSPPYVGQIDYHEQHAYAYELFNLPRRDNKEIGPLFKGRGKNAQIDYIKGISEVLLNISKFVKNDGDFFIVANDKLNLYPEIAKNSNLKIVDQFKRPVLNRTERDKQPYAEIIFHMKKKL